MPEWWLWITGFLSVVLIDLVLAGDNAVVIAMAARGLPGRLRRQAIVLGSAAAIGMRLLFAALVSFLLSIQGLRAVGGLLLLWIAWKLVVEERQHGGDVAEASSIWEAVRIIVLADVIMSLDNVVALVGVSHGNLWLVGLGLLLTIPLLVWGATLISTWMERHVWLVYAGAALLVWTALGMILEDPLAHRVAETLGRTAEQVLKAMGTAALVGAAWWRVRRVKTVQPQQAE